MLKEEFEARIEVLIKDAPAYLRKECARLFDSGGVDTESFGSEFLLPKIIYTVALENMVHLYMPLRSEGKEAVKNLRRF